MVWNLAVEAENVWLRYSLLMWWLGRFDDEEILTEFGQKSATLIPKKADDPVARTMGSRKLDTSLLSLLQSSQSARMNGNESVMSTTSTIPGEI